MKHLHKEALFIIKTLAKHGFTSYFAGGWVRDYLLGKESQDIDIATNATPENIQSIFPKTVPIGLQFGIVLVIIEEKPFEVATFRCDVSYKDGRRPTSVIFTHAKEDALRRDFTINGMFFDPLEEKVIDYVEGKKDLENRCIKAIGNPYLRIQEDRLRMIRAVRFACKLHFSLDFATRDAIKQHADQLFPYVAMERVMQELRKMLEDRTRKKSLLLLFSLGILQQIFPSLAEITEKQLQKRIVHFDQYPKNLPLIVYFWDLLDKPDIASLVVYTKLTNEEKKLGLFFAKYDRLLEEKNLDNYSWALFYANPLSEIYVQCAYYKKSKEKKSAFAKEHTERKKQLEKAIMRQKTKNFILSAEYLLQKGVRPGKKFGKLLKTAEKLAVNLSIEDPDDLFLLAQSKTNN